MSIKVFQTNKAGKIEFTRYELEKLLNETYNDGYRDGENHVKNSYWTWSSPSIVNTTPYYGTTCLDADKVILTNDVDTVTLTGTTNETTADAVTGKTNAATLSTAGCAINVNEAKKISGQVPSNDKTFKVDITASVDSPDVNSTQKTCQFNGMTFNLNDLAKTVDAMLNGKVDLFNSSGVKTSKVAVDNPFSNLAKELTSL